MLLIGSQALQIVSPALLERKPKDYDFITSFEDYEGFIKHRESSFKEIYPTANGNKIIAKDFSGDYFEFEIAWEGSVAERLIELARQDKNTQYATVLGQPMMVASLDLLFFLKSSHRYLKNSPHFLKTMLDYRKLREAGATIRQEWRDAYTAREKETYYYKHPKLNVNKSDFFKDDNINYVYDHDTIHVSIAHLDKPAYQYFKPADKEVWCDKEMFFAADENVRLYSVLEESYVLALERSQIPHRGVITPRRSFEIALMKVCTSITSGWWREYAYEHYFDVLALYNDNYVDRFWRAVDNGIVKRT